MSRTLQVNGDLAEVIPALEDLHMGDGDVTVREYLEKMLISLEARLESRLHAREDMEHRCEAHVARELERLALHIEALEKRQSWMTGRDYAVVAILSGVVAALAAFGRLLWP